MEENEKQELIEKFLQGKMTPEEEKIFKSQLSSDSELRKEAEATALLIKKMKEDNNLKDKEIMEEVNGKKKLSHKRLYVIASIAASIILILGVTHFYGVNKTQRLFKENYTTFSIDATRGGNGQAEVELCELFGRVESEKKMTEVIYRLEHIYNQVNTDYVYGMYANDIAWYLALAYLKDNRLIEARKLLLDIAKANEGNEYQQRAVNLYNEIENLYFL